MSDYKIDFKLALGIACLEKKMTRKKLSELSGVSETSLSRFSTGKGVPSLTTLTAIAAALGIKVSKLISLGETENTSDT